MQDKNWECVGVSVGGVRSHSSPTDQDRTCTASGGELRAAGDTKPKKK